MHSVGGLGGSIQGWSIDDVPNEVQHSPSRPRNMSIVLNRSSTVSAIQRCSSVKQQETGNRGDGLAFNTRLATKIKEERYNYTLIHHMLFCIQLSASKFTAGNARDVRVSDYHSVFKAFYDDFGIETTSKSDFDFEFKDYAPFVFKKIRDTFSVESQEYLVGLMANFSRIPCPTSTFYQSLDLKGRIHSPFSAMIIGLWSELYLKRSIDAFESFCRNIMLIFEITPLLCCLESMGCIESNFFKSIIS